MKTGHGSGLLAGACPMRRRTDRKPNIAALLCGLFVLCMAVFGVLGVVGWIAHRGL